MNQALRRGRPAPLGTRVATVLAAPLARAVTELLAPANLAAAQLLAVGWHSTPGPAGLGWGLLAAWWKLSLHTTAAAGTVAVLVVTFGPALVLAVPIVGLVAWARVRLGDHTPAQTLAGAALGGLVATTVFILLR
jgi:membrane-associated phospholipid phosphatase